MKTVLVTIVILIVLIAGVFGAYQLWWNANYQYVERTDVGASRDLYQSLQLVDDRIQDKSLAFDESLVDSRPYDGWQINLSGAVIKLDCPDIRPDREPDLLQLHPSYHAASMFAERKRFTLLPSANMIDGAAKQFDDGLYAALDLACFEGKLPFAPSAVEYVASVFRALPADGRAKPFLGAALELAGRTVELNESEQQIATQWIAEFDALPVRSKPIAFYTWSDDLRRVWRFFRFLQHPFEQSDLEIPLQIAQTVSADEQRSSDYQEIIEFYSSLSNPPAGLTLLQLRGESTDLAQLAQQHQVNQAVVCFFPPSTSKDTVLFNRLFADRPAAGVNMMSELIRRIRSGDLDLTPRENAGWYEHQVYALETLLVPERGAENQELLLTAKYKRRLIQAFEAMITKRRETHARQMFGAADAAAALPPDEILPRLRVEPCATFYLRTARSYAFLHEFLNSMIGADQLASINGLSPGGRREKNLRSELQEMIDRFYGFYLISCEDIGMAPGLEDGEVASSEQAVQVAQSWLDNIVKHDDLQADTRVAVPVLFSPISNRTRLWATIGVRLAKLDASFASAPKYRPDAESDWQDVDSFRLGTQHYVIAVDEFAELDLPGNRTLTRKELRGICDQHATKSDIVAALSSPSRP